MEKERDLTVDIAKGIGIILVVFGHTVARWGGEHEGLHRFIYSFHMPLFFYLSGIYIASGKDFNSFIKSKFTRLCIPFFFWFVFYIVLAILLQLVRQLVLHDSGAPYVFSSYISTANLSKLVLVPLLANWDSLYNARIYVDLWFLPAVFSIVVLSFAIQKYLYKINSIILFSISTVVSFIIVFLNNTYNFHAHIPWSLDIAVVCLPFAIFSKYIKHFKKLNILYIPVFFLVTVFLSKDIQIGIAGLRVEKYFHFFVSAFSGIFLTILISSRLGKYKIGRILAQIGMRTYLIFVFQGAIYMILHPVLDRIPFFTTYSTVSNFILFCTALFISYNIYPYFLKNTQLRLYSLGLD